MEREIFSHQLNQDSNYDYTFLGFKFNKSILRQRNKNPALLLSFVFLVTFIWIITFLITYIWNYIAKNNNFTLAPYLITLLLLIIVFGFYTTICFLRLSVINGINLKIWEWIFVLITLLLIAALFIYSLIYNTPFDSLGIYMIPSFVNVFLISFAWILSLVKNSTPFNEENYQLKFFSSRIVLAFFIAVQVLDIYSDFALSEQAERDQYDVSLVIILAPALIIFGAIDLIMFGLSVRFSVYSCIVVNKIVVIVLISFTLLYLRQDSLFLGWFGLATTVISFVYYIYKCCFGKKINKVEPLLEHA